MQISHVGLRNLRSYRAAELDLGSGTTLLSGDIGSGKTSLLYAVEMALFGFAEVDPAYLIRHGARDAEVSLTLRDGPHRWELRRRFMRRTRKGRETFDPVENSLAVDGKRVVYSATELRRRTIELLGFPDNPNPRAHSDVWRWAVYLAQERMRDVLDPDEEARMETVRKALGVEQYRLAGENARALARALQEEATNLAEQAARYRGIEEEAVRWRKEEDVARSRLSELEARERKLATELTEARAKVEEFEGRRREVAGAREALAQRERLAEELDRAVAQERLALQSARTLLVRLQADRSRESPQDDRDRMSAAAMAGLHARREGLIVQLGDLEGLRGQASVVAEEISERGRRSAEIGSGIDAGRIELARIRATLADLEATPPVDEPMPASDRTLEQLEAEKAQREDGLREADRGLTAARVELQELAELVQQGVCPRCHRPVEASEFEGHKHDEGERVARLRHELETATLAVRGAAGRVIARLEFDRLRDRWRLLEARRADLRLRESDGQSQSLKEEELRGRLDAERTALDERHRGLTDRLEGYDRLRAEVALVDREIREREERARETAARLERLAAIDRRTLELHAEIGLRERNEADRIALRSKVLQQIEADRGVLRGADDLEATWKTSRFLADELDRSLQVVLREAGGPRETLAEMKARLDEVARRQREREALGQRSSQLNVLAAWVDGDFRTAMVELERRRLLLGRRQFERRFSQYFAALVEDPALSARVDETFAPWVDIAGQATPAEALSGGERTALALAYRLALGRMVRDAGRLTLETLILDEPTEGFSVEQTVRMGDLLERLGLPQVILVSHERQLEGIADRVVRIRKQAGVSSVDELDRAPESAGRGERTASGSPGAPALRVRRGRTRRLAAGETGATGGNGTQVK